MPDGCNCEWCYKGTRHASDCAVHGVDTGEGWVSYEGPCNCGQQFVGNQTALKRVHAFVVKAGEILGRPWRD